MDEEISVPVSPPVDQDGFLRRECPTCEKQFKWYVHEEGDSDAETVEQYSAPCAVCRPGSTLGGHPPNWSSRRVPQVRHSTSMCSV